MLLGGNTCITSLVSSSVAVELISRSMHYCCLIVCYLDRSLSRPEDLSDARALGTPEPVNKGILPDSGNNLVMQSSISCFESEAITILEKYPMTGIKSKQDPTGISYS